MHTDAHRCTRIERKIYRQDTDKYEHRQRGTERERGGGGDSRKKGQTDGGNREKGNMERKGGRDIEQHRNGGIDIDKHREERE